jgi:hypothetical protein
VALCLPDIGPPLQGSEVHIVRQWWHSAAHPESSVQLAQEKGQFQEKEIAKNYGNKLKTSRKGAHAWEFWPLAFNIMKKHKLYWVTHVFLHSGSFTIFLMSYSFCKVQAAMAKNNSKIKRILLVGFRKILVKVQDAGIFFYEN